MDVDFDTYVDVTININNIDVYFYVDIWYECWFWNKFWCQCLCLNQLCIVDFIVYVYINRYVSW